MSNSTSSPDHNRAVLIGLLIVALSALAFSSGTEGAFQRVLGRTVGLPSTDPADSQRQLVTPADPSEDIPVALAATATDTGSTGSWVPEAAVATTTPADIFDGRADVVADAVASVATDTAAPTAEEAQQVAAANTTAPQPVQEEPSKSTTTTTAPTTVPPTTAAPTTTSAPTTAAPTTTSAPATTAAPAQTVTASGAWVGPSSTGYRAALLDFPSANDGPFGVTIDQDFLEQHADAAWLSYEGGRPVISGADANNRCLNILVTVTLRDSYVECPTRTQSDSWGYAGEVDDAPAVNILGAEDVIVEHNTITCSGYDADICSRSVRVGGRDALVQYNDLSFARGAVSLFHNTVFRFNYVHDLAFGFDPTRAGNSSDNITHNNVVNNLGYTGATVQGNYIVARYGRVSAQPSTYRNPHFHGVYSNGIVEVGDPINGFAFTNYLVNGNGDGLRIIDNYVEGVGRPFRCNSSSRHSSPSCADDVSRNVFAQDRFDGFNPPLFHDKDGNGSISGSCNLRSSGGEMTVLPSSSFGDSGSHGTKNC